jgi:hypothetical protein
MRVVFTRIATQEQEDAVHFYEPPPPLVKRHIGLAIPNGAVDKHLTFQ